MAEITSIRPIQANRMHALVVPREHGAWGMLLVPMFVGAVVGLQHGTDVGALGLFFVAAVGLFWLRTPVESYLGTSPMRAQTAEEKRGVLLAAAGIATIAGSAILSLFWSGRNELLIVIGGACGVAFAAQAVLKKLGRQYRMASQVMGAIGLTSTSAAAYYVLCGRFDEVAIALWLANWAFAGNQIHFVQLRLRAHKASCSDEKFNLGYSFFLGQVVLVAVIAAAISTGLLPKLALLAFAPALVRGFAWFFQKQAPLELSWLGITELLHGVTFGTLLISGFYLLH